MSYPGPNQDTVKIGQDDEADPTYEHVSYLGTGSDDEEDVRDLGFIVDDHDDRRGTLTENFQRLDDLDTNEPLETNRSGPIPHEVAMREAGPSPEAFATDYHLGHQDAERQEEDFVETSMLETDPDGEQGAHDFTDETFHDLDGEPIETDILGRVHGVADGLGSSVPIDLGSGGFQIQENPLATTGPDQRLLSGREHGIELDDYDDDMQDQVR
jgi:hypothetical protein